MRTLGNILWVIFGGFFWFLSLSLTSILFFITIIGIPAGVQIFKLARFVFWPFGKSVKKVKKSRLNSVLNVIWAITLGWIYAVGYFLNSLIFFISIIGIPFGLQIVKISKFVFLPFGRQFV